MICAYELDPFECACALDFSIYACGVGHYLNNLNPRVQSLAVDPGRICQPQIGTHSSEMIRNSFILETQI